MDDDVERGIIFTAGLVLGALVTWLILTIRGRRSARGVYEAAGGLAGALGGRRDGVLKRAAGAAAHLRERLS
jgi:hypothetical protein